MPNHLPKRTEETELEKLARESKFTEDERLVAQTIFEIKMLYGMETRLGEPFSYFLKASDEERAKYMKEITTTLNRTANALRKATQEYAKRLGISDARFNEIDDYVYKMETRM